jgi:hypothetical protein
MGIGGMGSANVIRPSKGGLTLDHVLSRLQGETGAELHSLTGTMTFMIPWRFYCVYFFSDRYLFIYFADYFVHFRSSLPANPKPKIPPRTSPRL